MTPKLKLLAQAEECRHLAEIFKGTGPGEVCRIRAQEYEAEASALVEKQEEAAAIPKLDDFPYCSYCSSRALCKLGQTCAKISKPVPTTSPPSLPQEVVEALKEARKEMLRVNRGEAKEWGCDEDLLDVISALLSKYGA